MYPSARQEFGADRQLSCFTITLDRILTPANVAAGFQAQSVTALGANLPILGIAFIAQTGAGTRPATLNVTCTGCGTAPPVGRFDGLLSYVAPDQLGGNLNLYWYLTNNTSGTLGYDYTVLRQRARDGRADGDGHFERSAGAGAAHAPAGSDESNDGLERGFGSVAHLSARLAGSDGYSLPAAIGALAATSSGKDFASPNFWTYSASANPSMCHMPMRVA